MTEPNKVSLEERLQQENDELRRKLAGKQLQINKTNAYWKGKLRRLKRQIAHQAVAI